MKVNVYRRILAIILSFVLLTSIIGDIGSKAFAEEDSQQELDIDWIVEHFSVDIPFIEMEIASGLTRNQIATALFHAQVENMTYQAAREALFPEEVNLSAQAETNIENENLPNIVLSDVDNPPAGEVYVPDGSESLDDKELAASNTFAARSTELPPQEEPPVINMSTVNQAPYAVTLENETISSLTGGLSLQQTDMILPGRNGMSFGLTREYNSSDAALYEVELGTESYPVGIYWYYVQFNAMKRQRTYDVVYDEKRSVEYMNDGIINSWPAEEKTFASGYTSEYQAQQRINQGVYYTLTTPDSRTETDYRTGSSSGSFPSSISYSSGSYYGTLYPQGSPYVTSGSFTPAQSRIETRTCTVRKYGKYNAQGVWVKEWEDPACPNSYPYNSGGFSGTLNRTTTDTINTCPGSGGTPNTTCTGQWRANYSGTVTKPASDTRQWRQNYSGTVSRNGVYGTTRYGNWEPSGNTYWRYVYKMSNVRVKATLGPATAVTRYTLASRFWSDAYNAATALQNSPNALVESSGDGYNYYTSSSPSPTIMTAYGGEEPGYRYVNKTKKPINEIKYPIGKGWSWKLPFVEQLGSDLYVHLAEGGKYKVENNTLKDYTWLGYTFTTDTSVTANSETSSYALSTVDGSVKQYFTSDGRLLQMKDAYDNTVTFKYTQHSVYNTKLLTEITDVIGNSITIAYTTNSVTLTKGNDTVTYNKGLNGSTEILQSVVDEAGRLTTYSYGLLPAKANLIGTSENSAISNPYLLLTKVTHPTGADTEYQYEGLPTKQYFGPSSFSEAYRIASRQDKLTYSNLTTESFNHRSITYTGHYAQTYGQGHTFSTAISNGLTSTLFNYRKVHLNDTQPAQYYLDSQVESASGVSKTMTNTYSKQVGSRTYAVPYPTTVVSSDNQTADTLTSTTQYDDYGNTTQTVDALGATSTYTYDSTKKWLLNSRQQVGTNQYVYTSYTRNTQGDITAMEVRENNASGAILKKVTFSGIDAHGNVTSMTITNGTKPLVYTVEYDTALKAYPVKQHVQVKDALGVASTITTEMQYDTASGRIIASIDGKGNQTDYTYDQLGRVTSVTHPDDSTINVGYNDTLNTVTYTDELGRQSRTQWNGLGWKMEEGLFGANGYEARARIGYDSHGRNIWSEDALGNRTYYEHDAWSRPLKTINPDLTESIINYNDALREIVATDASGNAMAEFFDKFGRSIRVEELTGGTNRSIVSQKSYYPINGALHQQTDAKQESTTYAYDLLGQLTTVTNPKGEITQYRYDQAGNHTKTIFADGNEAHKVYDELGRLLENIDPRGQKDTYWYDANGNRSKLIDKAGQIYQYTYNSRNFLLAKNGPTQTISFSYRADGSRSTMSEGMGTTSYNYAPHTGELLSVVYPDGKSVSYTYNKGQRASMATPFGDTIGYTYTVNGQLATLKWNNVEQANYNYLANGQLWKSNLGGVVESERTYTNGLLSELKHTGLQGNLNLGFTYGRDGNKNITSMEKTVDLLAVEDFTFTYDQLNRIETSTQFDEAYAYDNRGNRQTLQTDAEFGQAPAGQYEYDEWDRLSKVTMEDGKEATYRYNGDNLLVERTYDEVTTRYYYDGQQVIAEGIVQPGDVVTEKVSYLRGHGLAMLEEANGRKGYYAHNGHGDVVEIRGSNGELLNSYTYDIWGKPLLTSEAISNSFRYSGEYWDEATGLQYLRARWYDPSVGRFINEDAYEGEISNSLTLNLYTYVVNNPLRYIDPSGNKMEDDKYGNITKQDLSFIDQHAADFALAKWYGDKIGMQAAHDAANMIRLKYFDKVKRIDYINGGSSFVTRERFTVTDKKGMAVTTFVRGVVQLSFIASVSAQVSITSSGFSFSLQYGISGQIGGAARATVGAEMSTGKIERATTVGKTQQLPYLMLVGGELTYDMDDGDFQALVEAGIGGDVSIPIFLADGSQMYEAVSYSVTTRQGNVFPMYANEWFAHLGVK